MRATAFRSLLVGLAWSAWCVSGLGKLLPSARHERRVGAFLVRAAWERRPEGPAYLLPLLCSYISPASVLSSAHTSPLWINGTRRVFPSSPADGSFIYILSISMEAVYSDIVEAKRALESHDCVSNSEPAVPIVLEDEVCGLHQINCYPKE